MGDTSTVLAFVRWDIASLRLLYAESNAFFNHLEHCHHHVIKCFPTDKRLLVFQPRSYESLVATGALRKLLVSSTET